MAARVSWDLVEAARRSLCGVVLPDARWGACVTRAVGAISAETTAELGSDSSEWLSSTIADADDPAAFESAVCTFALVVAHAYPQACSDAALPEAVDAVGRVATEIGMGVAGKAAAARVSVAVWEKHFVRGGLVFALTSLVVGAQAPWASSLDAQRARLEHPSGYTRAAVGPNTMPVDTSRAGVPTNVQSASVAGVEHVVACVAEQEETEATSGGWENTHKWEAAVAEFVSSVRAEKALASLGGGGPTETKGGAAVGEGTEAATRKRTVTVRRKRRRRNKAPSTPAPPPV